MRVVAVIPARYASTRFPGKPLAEIAGRTMVEHVYRRASEAARVDEVLVATDDERIREAVEAFGGRVVMTRADHPTGTDRLAEVARGLTCQLLVNVQGDEPLLDPAEIDAVVEKMLDDPRIDMGTCAAPVRSEADLASPSVVKVVRDLEGFALYFSRHPIPFHREGGAGHLRHVGLYVYRREFLLQFAAMPPSPLEQAEALEQLRALENGHRIYVALTEHQAIGVDTPADLERVRALFREREGEHASG